MCQIEPVPDYVPSDDDVSPFLVRVRKNTRAGVQCFPMLSPGEARRVYEAGFRSVAEVVNASDAELCGIDMIGARRAGPLRDRLRAGGVHPLTRYYAGQMGIHLSGA